MKVRKSRILIRNLTTEDEGEYRCKATNGYGALSFTFYVYVRGLYIITYFKRNAQKPQMLSFFRVGTAAHER